jgi:hypothetical protein
LLNSIERVLSVYERRSLDSAMEPLLGDVLSVLLMSGKTMLVPNQNAVAEPKLDILSTS